MIEIEDKELSFEELSEKVIEWAAEKGILEKSDPFTQLTKTREEVDEFDEALLHQALYPEKSAQYHSEATMEGGDILVTLIIGAHLAGIDLIEGLHGAYNKIANRKGQMVNGMFVKEEDL